MARKTASWKTFVDAQDAKETIKTNRKDVVVPLVLWNEAPRVEVAVLHVLLLPISQPSQNSSAPVTEEERGFSNEDAQLQMCVFAGTVDGVVLYWRFEKETVAQVNMLVFPGRDSLGQPVVGIVSGTDEWGQSTLVSATKDGALARWQLPNGACAEANASLAKELAPLLGLEMLCNRRFAVVVSEESRLMVLDTWKMQLLYCMDTAQEQIRRSVTVGELRASPISPRPKLVRSSSGSGVNGAGLNIITADLVSNSPSTGGRLSPSRLSLTGGDSRRIEALLSSNSITEQQMQGWDAVVLSLGTEGLLKCFLWTQPRGSTSGTSFGVSEGGGSASVAWGFRWVQRTCWVISWADQADDITCSQSTSLKDGDNMSPQTALMGSIKSSYFPLSVHLSQDSSLVLLIWKTKFAILQRKWLCPLDTHNDRSPTSGSFFKSRGNADVGTCRILPEDFVRQAIATYGSTKPTSCSSEHRTISWENGEFLEDGTVVMWTNNGHAFQFMAAEASADRAGNFYIFTKDQDQLVPRSDSKELRVIDKALYITSMDRCGCCNNFEDKNKRRQSQLRGLTSTFTEKNRQAGFTSCINIGTSQSRSVLRVVHMCYRGALSCWTLPPKRAPSPTRKTQTKGNIVVAKVQMTERARFHTLTDGFETAILAAHGDTAENTKSHAPQQRECLSHLILGREDAKGSSTYEVVRRAGIRRKRQQELNDDPTRGVGNGLSIAGTAAAAMANSVLATALAPVTGRGGPRGGGGNSSFSEADMGDQRRADHLSCCYLLDVPIIVKGFSDGTVSIGLLSKEHLVNRSAEAVMNLETRLPCHAGKVTAIAHCFWGFGTDTSPPASAVGASSPANASRLHISSLKETHFRTKHNPFYRASTAAPTLKRDTSSTENPGHGIQSRGRIVQRALTIDVSDVPTATNGSASAPASTSQFSIRFMVFSGGSDGVLKVIEIILYENQAIESAQGSLLQCEARALQRFRNHRGAIQQISISPRKRGNGGAEEDDWDAACPERLVATAGVDRRVIIYAPRYARHPSAQARDLASNSRQQHCEVEWECILELSQHDDGIYHLDWHVERGLLYVECDDRRVHVWSTDTGILERTVPSAMLYGGGNASVVTTDEAHNSSTSSHLECSILSIGSTTIQLYEFGVLRSAEQLKKNWSSYYSAVSQSAISSSDNSTRTLSPSVYSTGSMELFMLSLLLSWGVTPAIDRSCHDILGIEPAHTLYSCALQDSASGALTIPVPWSSPTSPLFDLDSTSSSAIKHESIAAPIVPAFARNWQHSSALSANVALGVVTFCMSLMEYKHSANINGGSKSPMNKEEFQVLWSQLITQHSVVLPECVVQFREPALEELATFGFDSCEYTQLAARTLLGGVIKRLPPAERSALSAEYSAKLHWEMVRLETETGGSFLGSVGAVVTSGVVSSSSQQGGAHANNSTSNASSVGTDSGGLAVPIVVERLGSLVLLMSMIGTYFPGEISPAGAREVCDVLVFLLKATERYVASVSAELLTKGLMLFRPHLVDLSSLICQLLLIDMREKLRSSQSEDPEEVSSGPGGSLAYFNDGGTGGSNAAMSLLVEVGACESAFVLGLLQQEMHNHDRPSGFHESILLYMMELITTHYLLMCRHLPAFVDTIMACLDPTKPDRRRRCLPLSTRCLHSLVRRFPMVDFHKETQRLALGTMEAVIVIYDLRTATKWRVLDGHTSAVSAVRFRTDGQVLVSYAARDGSVRWWNSGNAGLFGSMLKMHQSCLKEHKLVALKESANGGAPSSTGGASAGLKQIIQTCRFHFLTRKDSAPDSPGGNASQPKQILRLTREDASQVQFLL